LTESPCNASRRRRLRQVLLCQGTSSPTTSESIQARP
jgi:hypothetical protein